MTQLPNPFLHSTVIPEPPAVASTADSACRMQNVARPDVTDGRDRQPISKSTLDPATGVDAAAGPDLTDPPVPAAVLISSSCEGTNAHQSRERCADNRPAFSEAVEVASDSHEAIPSNERRPQETPASAPSKNPDVGVLDATDCIHEIFFYARKLMIEYPEFAADTDEVPLFIRSGDHLRRWEA